MEKGTVEKVTVEKVTAEKTITVTQSFPLSRVASLLCTGMEQGIGYWASIYDANPPMGPGAEDAEGYGHANWALQGGAVQLRALDVNESHTLDRAAIERGLRLMAEKHPRHYGDFLCEREDATTGDVLIQLSIFGEVRYG